MSINVSRYGSGESIIFFHGWGFDAQVWGGLVPHLKDDYELILVDLPGFGQTPPQDWDIFKKNLLILLPKQFYLVGWSLGGLYAARLAIEAPERVKKLINITTSPKFLSDEYWPGADLKVFQDFYLKLSRDVRLTLHEFVKLQARPLSFTWNPDVYPSVEALKSGLEILSQWDLRKSLNRLNMPVTFMFGRLDPITPVATMNQMKVVYPDFNYVLFPKAAHMPFISHSEHFIKELTDFIR